MKHLLLYASLSAAAIAQTAAPAPKPAAPKPATTPKPAAATGTSTTPRKPSTGTTAKKSATTVAPKLDPAFNPKNAPPVPGTPSTLYTLSYIDIKIGDGPLAEPEKFYTVHYTGWLPDGTKFDSSVDRNEPFVFPYGAHRVIIGWDTGFEGMHVGGKRRILVPWELAYGADGRGPIPPKSPLIFDLELLGQSDTPPQPATAAPATPPPASSTQQQ